ncbi:MAG TPA: serine/threonine protein phosphatase, partial [Sinorhizobium sp.]|nr:serine/threonine protein phosphatase [Sinorhizobium sp.]
MVPTLDENDMETILAALAAGSARIERVQLKARTVWIKRYGRHGQRLVQRFQWLASRLTGRTFLRPSPLLRPEEAVDREVRQIAAFSAAGFMTPEVLYRGPTAIVLSHLGLPVLRQMSELDDNSEAHDALLIRCASELGKLHAAGLCHGRPHPRDFVLNEGRFGFLD